MKVAIKCQECGEDFYVYPSRAKDNPKFCSKECKFKNMRTRESKSRKYVACENCGKEYLLYNWRKKAAVHHFCSTECMGEYKNKQVEIPCEECKQPFKVKISRLEKQNPRYCSMECRNIAYRGENSPLYTHQKRKCEFCGEEFLAKNSQIDVGKGRFCSDKCKYKSFEMERPQDSKHFYGSAFWIRLRAECYQRDGYKCKKCGSDGELHAHHIVPRIFGGEDTIDNLESLCPSCHYKADHEIRKEYSLRGV